MNNKRVVVITVALVGVIAFFLFVGATPGNNKVGRYQLFQGYYVVGDLKNSANIEAKGIFLLDTTNGDVKLYCQGVNEDGKPYRRWIDARKDFEQK